MTRLLFFKLCIVVAIAGLSVPASAEEPSRYEELMASPGAAKTVQDFALVILATPLRRGQIEAQMRPVWWANHPNINMNDADRTLAMSEFVNQFDEVERVVGGHQLRKLDLIGFSKVGTQRNLELYYAADSKRGPILFRLSLSFNEEGQPTLHGIGVFVGFDAVRDEVVHLQHHAGKRVASYTIDPAPKDEDNGPNA